MIRKLWSIVCLGSAVIPMVCFILTCGLVRAQEAGKNAYDTSPSLKATDYKDLNEVPPTEYIRKQIPEARVPAAQGEYYDAILPDTCNLAERAKLFVDNYLNRIVIPHLDYEPFDRGSFEKDPPRLFLSMAAYLCALSKYRESLPLMRIMSGSRTGLEIDKAWAENILHCIGPDGLSYVPRTNRPWDVAGAYEWLPNKGSSDQYAFLWTGNGRQLGALAIYYQLTGDEVWNETARRMVDRLNQLAIKKDKVAFFPRFVFLPGEKIGDEEIKKAIDSMYVQSASETERNTALWQTWIIVGLAQYYGVSRYEPAKELAYGLVNYMRESKYVEEWKSHFHCISLGIHGMLELAAAAHDHELAEYARKAYEVAKSGKRSIAFPSIGYFVNGQDEVNATMEGCSIADMTTIAVKMAKMGMGDNYWEDVDHYVRNTLTDDQFTSAGQITSFTANLKRDGKTKPEPVSYTQLADQFPEVMVGAWQLHFRANNRFAVGYWDPCCTGNCSRAIYYVWQNILGYDQGELTVRLLLNRASPWADVESYIPYIGRVDLKIKKPCNKIKIRMNDWIDKAKVTCKVDEKSVDFSWTGNYLVLGPVKSKKTVTIEFPISEHTEKLESFGCNYAATFRGNECVDLNPKGPDCPTFQRGYYRTGHPRFVKVRQFVCETPIEH